MYISFPKQFIAMNLHSFSVSFLNEQSDVKKKIVEKLISILPSIFQINKGIKSLFYDFL